ncbi:LysM peptidoglycan-binding domain-containing protein [Macrococcus bovicus]|uniref:LysM peptidoglycan-binding domain-containing protein n=2 Tax=Macrococcus bovicus TaxID=69968 RepID=A0A4R6BXC2_9STAP|nr:N-acetylmuramoyl-L-alanine amidase [Macrococcus bovicus]TDM12647.1 LysM peptidoglycan-binding domain-containing protein [Macrococcus bovicus]
MTKTRAELNQRLDWYIGKFINPDGLYGYQCADLPTDLVKWATGITMTGNANQLIDNHFNGAAEVLINTPDLLPKPGDILIYTLGRFDNQYGHVAVVHSDITLESCVVIEQNWNGKADTPVKKRRDNYEGLSHIIRIKYKEEEAMSKRILLTAGHGGNDPGAVGNGTNERDFIRENIVDNIAKYLRKAGNDVTVFDKKYDMLTWTFDPSKQYGLYWAKKQKFDEVIEFHLDAASPSASGGHTIIWGGFNPDKMDTRIQKALSDTVGVIRPISKRTDLGNARIAAELGVSYRLVELGFITSKKDMNYIKGNLQSFTKEIAEAIHGGGIDDPKRAEKKKPASLSNATTHKVVKGDTLYSISKKYGVTIKDLIDLNNKIKSKNYKDNTQIAVGTVLKVK